jgi:hypothetical protein
MDVKQAIMLAKQYIADIFGEEGAYNIGLEEVQFDDDAKTWEVTIGFSRPWDKPAFQNALAPRQETRTYKIVDIYDPSAAVMGVRNRLIPSSSSAL